MRILYRRAIVTGITVSAMAISACDQPTGRNAGNERNCSRGEGQRHYEAYANRLKTATDWQKVGWIRQVAITKWMACRNQIGSHHPLDDCLDKLSYDNQNASLAFSVALDRCIREAKQKLSK